MSITNKEEIIRQAAVFFFRKGYESTSLSEIAQAVKIQKPGLFFHFKNKEDLYHKVIDKYLIDVQSPKQKFGKIETVSLREFIDFYLQKVERTMQLVTQIIQSGKKTAIQYFFSSLECCSRYDRCAQALYDFNNEELDIWESVIQHARQTGEIRADVNPRALAENFRYAFLGMSYILSTNGGVKINELKDLFYNIYSNVKLIK
jgi:AcrR family transcriptional regulator